MQKIEAALLEKCSYYDKSSKIKNNAREDKRTLEQLLQEQADFRFILAELSREEKETWRKQRQEEDKMKTEYKNN